MEDFIINRAKKLFRIEELVDQVMFTQYGEGCWAFLHPQLLETVCALKEFFKDKQLIINTWGLDNKVQKKCGFFSERGLRDMNSRVGAKSSAHKKGKAVDFDVWVGSRKLEASEVRKQLISHISLFPYIKGQEEGVNWCHVDCMFDKTLRSHQKEGFVYIFNTEGFIKNISRG